MNQPLRIFVGHDSREPVALHVLTHSIMKRASRPVSITPLMQQSLRDAGYYSRERGPTESTEFSLTRFLVPFLSDYSGISIFMDCDMLCLADICDLEFEISKGKFTPPSYGVMVCKHEYTPRATTKFLDQQQTAYPRKNWSSLMVFDNEQCKALTLDYVNQAEALELHRFHWMPDEKIGGLPLEWNWLVGEYGKSLDTKIVHYTLGGPWFTDCAHTDYAAEWFHERDDMVKVAG